LQKYILGGTEKCEEYLPENLQDLEAMGNSTQFDFIY
jgi:hypothetical protein